MCIIVMSYYGVYKGKKTGVYKTWEETKQYVLGYSGAKFKKFKTQEEAALFSSTGIVSNIKKPQQREISDYFHTELKGLERYGIITRERPKKTEMHPMFKDTKYKKPNKENPWSDYPSKNKLVVFTDGSCIEVKKTGQKKAGYGIYFPQKVIQDISGELKSNPTNQRAELKAIQVAISSILASKIYEKNRPDIYIFSDSEYSINCLTKWHKTWIKNNWKSSSGKPVENLDIIKPTLKLLQKLRVVFQHVKAHTGKTDRYSLANHAADRLAFKASSDQIN